MERALPQRDVLLTLAVEDYFHVGAFGGLIPTGRWSRFERRIEQNTEKALSLLAEHGTKATFFVMGWVADNQPALVRRILAEGHEVASQGYWHRSLRQMNPAEFRADLRRSKEALERATGRQILGHRVPQFMGPDQLWALDILAEEGYAYDSSLRPLLRGFAHEPWRRHIHPHEHQGRTLLEVPVGSVKLLGLTLPIAGGNFFRQLPKAAVEGTIERWLTHEPDPFVMYLHVWELDPEQPKVAIASPLQRLRHYRNLDRMPALLTDVLRRHRCGPIAEHLGLRAQAIPSAEVRTPECSDRGSEDEGREALRQPLQPCSEGCRDESRTRPQRPTEPYSSTATEEARTKAGRRPAEPLQAVTLVIPCYHEAASVAYLHNTLKGVFERLSERYELSLLFVDDGSQDDTVERLNRQFADWPRCQVLRHEHNQGVAAAIMTGLKAATTEIVCSMDCDCTYDPLELANMIPKLKDGVDLVTGSPYHPDGAVRNVPAWRLGLSRGASYLYRQALNADLHTFTSCFRVYRRSAVVDLPLENGGFLGVAELLARLLLQGGRVVEHPATLEVRVFGQSKMKTARAIGGHLKLLSGLLKGRLETALRA